MDSRGPPLKKSRRAVKHERDRRRQQERRKLEKEQPNPGPSCLATPPPLPAYSEEPCSSQPGPSCLPTPPPLPAFSEEPCSSQQSHPVVPPRLIILPSRPFPPPFRPVCRVAPFRVVPVNRDPAALLEPPDSPSSSRGPSPTPSTASTVLVEIDQPELITLDD